MDDEAAVQMLRDAKADLERKLAKRERSGSYGDNVTAIRERLAEIDEALGEDVDG